MRLPTKRFLITTTLVLAAAAGWCYVRAANRNLIERSTRLVNVKGWWPNTRKSFPYQWINSSEIFVNRGFWVLQNPFIYDSGTGVKRPLTDLNKLVTSTSKHGVPCWTLSNDARRIVWDIPEDTTVYTARLDGSESKKWHVSGTGFGDRISDLWWLSDNRHWAAITRDSDTLAERLACTADATRIAPSSVDPLTVAELRARLVNGGGVPDELLEGSTAGVPAARTTAIDWKHKHVAKLDAASRPRSLGALVHSIVPAFPARPQNYCSLSISDRDGAHSRLVGLIASPGTDVITDLAWLPDGKHVSYIYKDVLYKIDVSEYL
jgi:hypothetical protein